MNLFIAHHEAVSGKEESRFGSGWENLFTEQLAFFLLADGLAANAFASLLVCQSATVAEITTQFGASDGRPDIRLHLTDGGLVLVENKFGATLGPAQLERYLKDGRVALVSERSQRVAEAVLASAEYLRPAGREHFEWTDVYDAIRSAPNPPDGFGELRAAFLGYMRELGFAPSALTLEWRRLFDDRTDPHNQRVQKVFGQLLRPLDRFASQRGLKSSGVSHKSRQFRPSTHAAWRHIVVGPERVRADYMASCHAIEFDPGFEGLTARVVFEGDRRGAARDLCATFGDGFIDERGRQWRPIRPRPVSGTRWTVGLTTPLGPILGRQAEDAAAVSTAATAGLVELLRALKQGVNDVS